MGAASPYRRGCRGSRSPVHSRSAERQGDVVPNLFRPRCFFLFASSLLDTFLFAHTHYAFPIYLGCVFITTSLLGFAFYLGVSSSNPRWKIVAWCVFISTSTPQSYFLPRGELHFGGCCGVGLGSREGWCGVKRRICGKYCQNSELKSVKRL